MRSSTYVICSIFNGVGGGLISEAYYVLQIHEPLMRKIMNEHPLRPPILVIPYFVVERPDSQSLRIRFINNRRQITSN